MTVAVGGTGRVRKSAIFGGAGGSVEERLVRETVEWWEADVVLIL